MKFQVLLNEEIAQNAILQKQNAILQKQTADLKQEVESEINMKNSVIWALEEQMKYVENLKKTLSQREREMEKLQWYICLY